MAEMATLLGTQGFGDEEIIAMWRRSSGAYLNYLKQTSKKGCNVLELANTVQMGAGPSRQNLETCATPIDTAGAAKQLGHVLNQGEQPITWKEKDRFKNRERG